MSNVQITSLEYVGLMDKEEQLQAIADALTDPPGIPEQEAIDNLGDEYPYLMMLLDALIEEAGDD